jgi:uncharacterized damage-inducible protein DinB
MVQWKFLDRGDSDVFRTAEPFLHHVKVEPVRGEEHMKIGERMLPEFDREMANTRKTLERVPEERFGWKPHEKSMPMGRLASHIAEIPGWVSFTLDSDSFDANPPGGRLAYQPMLATSRKELLEAFDRNITAARAALASVEDEKMMQPWSLLSGGKVVFTIPKIAVQRSFVMNHLIHHRAQLGVYLRLNDVPVPALYGPSADEK